MSGFIQRDVVLNSQGHPVAGATITVGTSAATGIPCSPLATIYTDETLGVQQANPFTTDGLGNFSFAVSFGSTYVITVTGVGLTGYSYRITTPQQNDVTQINFVEQGSAPSGVSGSEVVYGKVSDHTLKVKENNGSEKTLAKLESIQTWTQQQTYSAGITFNSGSALILIGTPLAQITSDQNDYNTAVPISKISSDAARNITGIVFGLSHQVIALINIGSFNITLKNQNASSQASNRFLFAGDLVLTPNKAVILYYDPTASNWRALAQF